MNFNLDNSKTICGTPEYLAPEILFKLGYGKEIDWWTMGCLMYELVVGWPPFYSSDRNNLFHKIKFTNPNYPSYLSVHGKNLLEQLLKKDPMKRIGFNGANEIKEHPWFININWNYLE